MASLETKDINRKMTIKYVPKIIKRGYPVYTPSGKVSEKWRKAHQASNRHVLNMYGSKVAEKVNKIHVPKDELLGSHTKKGVILISSRVPRSRKIRRAVIEHERFEHKLMSG